MKQTYLTLQNGVEIPQLGLGVYGAKEGAQTEQAVAWALEAGYRHFDTAAAYGNENSVGSALRKSGVPRNEVFLTGKIWNSHIRAGLTLPAFYQILENLGTDYLDLCLLHWPVEGKEKAWSVLVQLYEQKLVRAIGVSNFHVHHLNDLIQATGVKPMLDQIESHPLMNNQTLIDTLGRNGIAVGVWSPLGGPKMPLLSHPALKILSEKYGRTPAQIVLRWDIQRNVVVIPKSVHQDRIVSNSQIFDFELSEKDMEMIQSLNVGFRVGPNPDNFDF
ncbi:MAG: aldo/keto reductase [Muribaculaceae bacterium]|jgi:diketogulonate reductase-like aldo/keto reductase|nr:aldo/keto reductase [Muribaculaceae bacterium]